MTPPSSTPPRVTSSDKKSRRHTGDEPASASASHCPPPAKVWKGLKYKYWTPGAIQPTVKYKKPTDREITEVRKCGPSPAPVLSKTRAHRKGKHFETLWICATQQCWQFMRFILQLILVIEIVWGIRFIIWKIYTLIPESLVCLETILKTIRCNGIVLIVLQYSRNR